MDFKAILFDFDGVLGKTMEDNYQAWEYALNTNGIHESKPSPEPYLKAAEKLVIIPRECLVVENAPLGIESAKNAGMTCIAVASTLEKQYLEGADKIVDCIIEINAILEKGGIG